MSMNDELFDWNSEIEEDGQEFVTVEPGDYAFTVTKVERKQYAGSDKIPACNMVTVYGEIDVPKGTATFRENLYLVKKYEWKLSGFFRCLGMKKHGEKLRMNFPGSVGKRGYAKFGNREYSGQLYNQLETYYDYDPARMNTAKAAPAEEDDLPW